MGCWNRVPGLKHDLFNWCWITYPETRYTFHVSFSSSFHSQPMFPIHSRAHSERLLWIVVTFYQVNVPKPFFNHQLLFLGSKALFWNVKNLKSVPSTGQSSKATSRSSGGCRWLKVPRITSFITLGFTHLFLFLRLGVHHCWVTCAVYGSICLSKFLCFTKRQ